MELSPAEIFKQRKVCVIIPTFNNATTLKDVVLSVLKYTDQVIVVNDGSTDSTGKILQEFRGLQIVAYEKNNGKGFALRQGFRSAIELGYDYAITIDSDGQHFSDDLPLFLTALERHTKAVIIGARNMAQSGVPGKSSFGNRFSNFWFWVETGIRRSDTQSGYRLYPLTALRDLKFITYKYEFEIEVLVRAAWKGIEIIEVPVRVYYPEKEKRISHFRPFRDFTRISVLNTVLVTIALLYIKPRDFFRSLKKKISDKYFGSFLQTRRNLTLSKLSRLGLVYLWGFFQSGVSKCSFLFPWPSFSGSTKQ